MSNYVDEFDEEDDQPEQRKDPVRARLKQLEKQNAELLKNLEQANEAQRKLVFMEAGVNTSDPRFKYFLKGYDGDLNADAIREALVEAQLIAPPQDPASTDQQAWRESNRIAAGAEQSMPEPSWMKRIADASSEEELYAVFAEAQAAGVDLGG